MKKDEKMSIEDMTAYMRIVPERKASYAEFPDTMNDEIKEYLAGNLCRCSGYEGQLRGILNFLAWKKQQGGAS